MTLKAKILTLWCRGRSYDEIVEALGCSRTYVRAAISRARYGGKTPGDIAHNIRMGILNRDRYHLDPDFRQRQRDRNRKWRLANVERLRAYDRARYLQKKAQRQAQIATAALGGSTAVGDSHNSQSSPL